MPTPSNDTIFTTDTDDEIAQKKEMEDENEEPSAFDIQVESLCNLGRTSRDKPDQFINGCSTLDLNQLVNNMEHIDFDLRIKETAGRYSINKIQINKLFAAFTTLYTDKCICIQK